MDLHHIPEQHRLATALRSVQMGEMRMVESMAGAGSNSPSLPIWMNGWLELSAHWYTRALGALSRMKGRNMASSATRSEPSQHRVLLVEAKSSHRDSSASWALADEPSTVGSGLEGRIHHARGSRTIEPLQEQYCSIVYTRSRTCAIRETLALPSPLTPSQVLQSESTTFPSPCSLMDTLVCNEQVC